MTIKEDTIVLPLPSDELLKEMEGYWRQVLPKDYREFIVKYNGARIADPSYGVSNKPIGDNQIGTTDPGKKHN